MSEPLSIVYLARHGETAWTISRQHTGLTDLPLTERGERTARRLEERLRGVTFAAVLTSPLQRATRTCRWLQGSREVDKDLVEWDYGRYEGAGRPIRAERPGGNSFATVAPVESPQQVSVRADRIVKRVRGVETS